MVRPRFDPNRDLVAARSFTWQGEDLSAGDPFPKEGVPSYRLRTLYGARMVNHAEKPADPVVVTAEPGGMFAVSAPWLDEPFRVRGTARANREADKLRREGEPDYHHGVAVVESPGGNGWWMVGTDWTDEIEKVHGEQNARARAAELRAEGPPPDPRTDVTVSEGDGEFVVNAPWLEEAMLLPTRDAAEEQAEALRTAGPPEGWEPAPTDE